MQQPYLDLPAVSAAKFLEKTGASAAACVLALAN
jgi:hypothetical protein